MVQNRGQSPALLAVALTVMILGRPAVGEDWITRSGDALQRGYVPASLNPADFSLAWRWQPAGAVTMYPVSTGEGRVYVSTSNSLYALDASTGTPTWNLGGALFLEPSYANGSVFIPTGAHSSSCGITCSEATYVRRYSADDGTFHYRSPFSSQWSKGWGLTPYGDSIYMNGGYYGGLYEFNQATGASRFLSLAQYDSWAPAVDQKYVYAYVEGHLQVVDRASMTIAKSIANPDYSWQGYSMYTVPVIGGDNHVIVRYGGRLINFDVGSGTLNWTRNRDFTGQPVYADGLIYTIASGALSVVDEATGDQVWAWELTGKNLQGNMVLTDSHLFVQTDAQTYAIDLSKRTSVWSYPATGHLALDDNQLYIADPASKSVTAISVPEPGVLMAVLPLALGLSRRRERKA